uniref:Uncharacterized protein n=1 Tax=Megaselia scalaris TaxID=36166 RepID=T1GIX3_MEGSC
MRGADISYCDVEYLRPRLLNHFYNATLVRGVSRSTTLIANGSNKALHNPPPMDPSGSWFENTHQSRYTEIP